MLLSKFISKDVVNVSNGEKLGKIRDIEIDDKTGSIEYLIVSNVLPVSNLFKKNKSTIEFNRIEKIGEAVILVNVGN